MYISWNGQRFSELVNFSRRKVDNLWRTIRKTSETEVSVGSFVQPVVLRTDASCVTSVTSLVVTLRELQVRQPSVQHLNITDVIGVCHHLFQHSRTTWWRHPDTDVTRSSYWRQHSSRSHSHRWFFAKSWVNCLLRTFSENHYFKLDWQRITGNCCATLWRHFRLSFAFFTMTNI